jgi:gas vesicle protein
MKGSGKMHYKILEKHMKKISEAMNLENSKEEARKKGIYEGLVFGALLGTVLGILYAPDKGEVTRHKAKEEVFRLKDQMEEHFEQGKERATVLLDEKKGRAEEIWLSTKTNFTTDHQKSIEDEESEIENKSEE